MRRSMGGLFAAVLIISGASPALAQPALSRDLPLTTLSQSGQSGIQSEQTKVLKTAAEFRAFFGPNGSVVMPNMANVDVLVAAYGPKSAGYGISITKATLMTGGFTGGHCFVDVQKSGPIPGMMYPAVMTSPAHIVSVPKGAIAYHWNVMAPIAGFETLDLAIHDPLPQTSQRLELQASGDCVLYQSSPTARYAPLPGVATAAELRAVQAAFRAADVATLPADIFDPRAYFVAPARMTLTSTLQGGAVHTTEANLGAYEPYEARVTPLVDAIRAITTRLLAPATFERISMVWSGGLAPWSQELVIEEDGTTVFTRTGLFGNPSSYWNGRATAAELTALTDAISAGDLRSLPGTIDDPVLVMDVPSLHIVATLGGTDTTIHLTKAGFYDTFEARLKPVVDAATAISERLVQQGDQTFTATVRRSGSRYSLNGTEVRAGEPTAQVLSANVGKTIVVTGRFYTTSAGRQLVDVQSIQGATTANLNLRQRSTTTSPVLRVLPRGTTVKITSVNYWGDWYFVQAGADSGWVSARYVKVAQ